jgi:hypothetical protein
MRDNLLDDIASTKKLISRNGDRKMGCNCGGARTNVSDLNDAPVAHHRQRSVPANIEAMRQRHRQQQLAHSATSSSLPKNPLLRK